VDVNLDRLRALTDLPWATLSEALYFRISTMTRAPREPSFHTGGGSRFDDPEATFETLYAARKFSTCFLETVVRDKDRREIAQGELAQRALVLLAVDTSALKVVELHGSGARALGLNAAQLQAVDNDYALTRAIAKALHDHDARPHGLVYRSRFNDEELALVLFGRARPYVRILPGATPVSLLETIEVTGLACRQENISIVRP
jgi:hypothetical protein